MTDWPDLRLSFQCRHDADCQSSSDRRITEQAHEKPRQAPILSATARMLRWIAMSFALSTTLTGASAAADQIAEHSKLSASQTRPHILVIGRVSQHPEKHAQALNQMASYLAAKLGHLGITDGAAIIAPDNARMIKMLRDGRVDVVSETALSALLFEEEAGAKILLREWKKGAAQYHTVFFARADSGIQSLADLRGRKIAFEDPGSTSGYILPLAVLNRSGLPVVELADPHSPVSPTEVGFAFAHSELNITMWVQRGLVYAGVLSNLDWEDAMRAPEVIKKDLVIFHEGPSFIRSLLVVRDGLRADVVGALRDALLGIHEEPGAKPILASYNKVTRYDEISGEADQHLLEAREVYSFVRRTLDWMKPNS